MRQTTIVKNENVKKEWYLIDAENQVLGRLAVLAATILRGKNKPDFTPHVDMGDNIIITNAAKVLLTANKEEDKIYRSHSGYPGGLKEINAARLRAKKPNALLEIAIRGMLPKSKLGDKQFGNLYVYSGTEHKHAAQQPKEIKVGNN